MEHTEGITDGITYNRHSLLYNYEKFGWFDPRIIANKHSHEHRLERKICRSL